MQDVIERAVILTRDATLRVDDTFAKQPLPTHAGNNALAFPDDQRPFAQVERQHIDNVLNQTRWRIGGPRGAAVILGLHPNTLRSRMKKLGVSRPSSSA